MNKSDKSDHPHQWEPWCFVEVVNKSEHERKTSSPQHSRCSYASGELIRINFHPKTAKKMAPHCMARLDLVNCISQILSSVFLRYCHLYFSDFDFGFLCFFVAAASLTLASVTTAAMACKLNRCICQILLDLYFSNLDF